MKKLFAFAAIAIAGALISATPSDAGQGSSGGGFKGKPGGLSKSHFARHHHRAHRAHRHHAGHARGAFHHRFAPRLGFPYGTVLGASYAAPLVVQAAQQEDEFTGTAEQRRLTWRGNYPVGSACAAEYVTVPAAHGGKTTIRITRCYAY